MTKKKEGLLESEDAALAKACGWDSIKWGWDGYPDRLYYRGPYFFTVERKRPGKKQRANQIARQKELEAQGVYYHVVDDKGTLEQMREILMFHNRRYDKVAKALEINP